MTRYRGAPPWDTTASLSLEWLATRRDSGLIGLAITQASGGRLGSTSFSSDGVAAYLMDVQRTLGDGPAQGAIEERRPVLLHDLRIAVPPQWAFFAAEVRAVGGRSFFALPVQSEDSLVGCLTVHGPRPVTLDGWQLTELLELCAAVATPLLREQGASVLRRSGAAGAPG